VNKDEQLERFLEHFEQALDGMSCWLDDFLMRLVHSHFELDIDKAVKYLQVRTPFNICDG